MKASTGIRWAPCLLVVYVTLAYASSSLPSSSSFLATTRRARQYDFHDTYPWLVEGLVSNSSSSGDVCAPTCSQCDSACEKTCAKCQHEENNCWAAQYSCDDVGVNKVSATCECSPTAQLFANTLFLVILFIAVFFYFLYFRCKSNLSCRRLYLPNWSQYWTKLGYEHTLAWIGFVWRNVHHQAAMSTPVTIDNNDDSTSRQSKLKSLRSALLSSDREVHHGDQDLTLQEHISVDLLLLGQPYDLLSLCCKADQALESTLLRSDDDAKSLLSSSSSSSSSSFSSSASSLSSPSSSHQSVNPNNASSVSAIVSDDRQSSISSDTPLAPPPQPPQPPPPPPSVNPQYQGFSQGKEGNNHAPVLVPTYSSYQNTQSTGHCYHNSYNNTHTGGTGTTYQSHQGQWAQQQQQQPQKHYQVVQPQQGRQDNVLPDNHYHSNKDGVDDSSDSKTFVQPSNLDRIIFFACYMLISFWSTMATALLSANPSDVGQYLLRYITVWSSGYLFHFYGTFLYQWAARRSKHALLIYLGVLFAIVLGTFSAGHTRNGHHFDKNDVFVDYLVSNLLGWTLYSPLKFLLLDFMVTNSYTASDKLTRLLNERPCSCCGLCNRK